MSAKFTDRCPESGMSIIWGSDYLYKYQIVQIPKTQVFVSKTNS